MMNGNQGEMYRRLFHCEDENALQLYFTKLFLEIKNHLERDRFGQEIEICLQEAKKQIRQLQKAQQNDQADRLVQRLHFIKRLIRQQIKITSEDLSVNWRDLLLDSHQSIVAHSSYVSITPRFHADFSVELDHSRFKFMEVEQQFNRDVSGISGSSFTTDREQLSQVSESHVLDAFSSAYHYDSQGKMDGLSLALGDGCGGHFGDIGQDVRIARASKFATKHVVRLLSSFHSAKAIACHLPKIIDSVCREISVKATGEGTTLICAGVFLEETGWFHKVNRLHVAGFNIGDGMLIGWDPTERHFYNLSPAHVSEAGTAIVPTSFKEFEIHPIDEYVSPRTIIIALSDGVTDFLPHTEKEGVYPNQLKYRERRLDERQLTELFSQAQNVSDPRGCIDFLTQLAVNTTESERQRLQRLRQLEDCQPIQIGDDISAVAIRLPENCLRSIASSNSGWVHRWFGGRKDTVVSSDAESSSDDFPFVYPCGKGF